MCNTSDLGTECANPHETRAIPERILLYDQHPGGIGITAQVNGYDLSQKLYSLFVVMWFVRLLKSRS